jgi:hypothetical protein
MTKPMRTLSMLAPCAAEERLEYTPESTGSWIVKKAEVIW